MCSSDLTPTRQQQRPPPVAEAGRSCWGSGQQDTSALHDVDAGCRNPDRWHPVGMTVGFNFSSCLRLNPPVACGDSPPNSGALGMAQSSVSLPRPPLLGNNDDCRQWRKQGGVVGAAASRTQVQNFARSGRWVPQPVRWHPAGMTVGFTPPSGQSWAYTLLLHCSSAAYSQS